MKLLYLCPEYPPAPAGGIGHFYRTLAREAARRGARVAVVALDPAAEQDVRSSEDGVDVLRLGAQKLAGPIARWGRRQFDGGAVRTRLALRRAAEAAIRDNRPDVVETYDWSGPAPWKPPAPLVVRMHGSSSVRAGFFGRRPSRLIRYCERATLRAADRLAAVSGWIGRRTVDVFGLDGGFEELPNGVDAELFSPGRGEPKAAEVLYVGSVREDKGVGLLLETFRLLAARRTDLELRVVGPLPPAGIDAPFLAQRLAAIDPQLRRRIRFEGRRAHSELPAVYRRAAVCVFPSGGEAHPLACLEAMSCGAAVVVNAEGGMGETVEEGVSGLQVHCQNPAVWARSIELVLSHPVWAAELGSAARRRVEQCYALDATVGRNLAFYETVAGGER